MRVLILTITCGQGHNQTGIAVSDYLEKNGVDCVTLDAYKYISTVLGDGIEKGYLLSTKYLPSLYGKVYRLAEKKESEELSISKITNKAFTGKVVHFIKAYQPDVIVCTHIFAAMLVTAAEKKLAGIKSVGIITDFTVHPFWEDSRLDYYVTASHLLNHQCAKKGISEDKILPFGIPIEPKFSIKHSKEEACEKLGIPRIPTILIMMGSMGFGNVSKVVDEIDKMDLNFQILCVCGNNNRARGQVEKMPVRHKVFCYGFVNNVDVMMDAADFIVTKPGGLSVSESLAKGLPMILVNPIPGQEDRNLEFLLNNGLAMAVSKTFSVGEAVYQMYQNQWRMENLPAGVRYLGKPDAAKRLGDFVISLGKQNKEEKEEKEKTKEV